MNKQNNVKGAFLGILAVIIVVGGITALYQYEQRDKNRTLAKRIAELSSPRGGPPDTVEGLRAAIAAYEDAIEQYVRDAAQTGTYWKILAIRLTDKGMHREALDALERALQYNAEDATVFYLTGVSAVIVAKASVDPRARQGTQQSERDRYLAMAEQAFRRSIELDSAYAKPRLELGILYMIDLDRNAEAVPHLEKYMELMPRSVDGMFALARAYYMTENYEKAVELYDRILVTTKDAAKKAEAQNNRDYILGNMYG
jgi:tetratricopeptide (TPR) repeat protein